jgi:hypothetical protein
MGTDLEKVFRLIVLSAFLAISRFSNELNGQNLSTTNDKLHEIETSLWILWCSFWETNIVSQNAMLSAFYPIIFEVLLCRSRRMLTFLLIEAEIVKRNVAFL